MRSSQTNYAVVGTFVLVLLAGLVAAVAVLTGRTGATDTYHAVYDNVAGVKPGTPVTFEGYRVGQVDAVRPTRQDDGTMAFRVGFSVEAGFPIPEDSTAAVASTGLLSGAAIRIEGGTAEATLAPGGRIAAGSSADVFAAVSKVAGEINRLSEGGLQPLLAKLNRYTEELGRTLTDTAPKMAADLRRATRALAEATPETAGNIREFSARLNTRVLGDDNLGRIDSALANLEQASRTLNQGLLGEANRARVRAALANAEQVSAEAVSLAENAEQTRRQLDQLIAEMNAALGTAKPKMQASLQDLRYSLQVVSQHVDSIAYNLENTSRNMSEFSRQIRQDPSLLIRGGDTGAAQ